jgi:tetratricopeptide (TPR) repeat protein
MHRTLIVLATTLIAWAAAADVVVHPFRSQDPFLGVAVAERVAGALEGVEVLGPELAPALIAPVPVPGGFFNPLAVLPDGVVDRSGVAVLGDALGVAAAVSGTLTVETDALRLELRAAVDGRGHTATVTAASDDLDGLAARAAAIVARWTGASTAPVRPLDLAGDDGAIARARALLGAGFAVEALEAFDGVTGLDATDAALRDGLAAALAGDEAAPAALAAVVALFQGDGPATSAAFERWAASGAPPVAYVWLGVLALSVEDDAAAVAAFDRAAAYPYGRAARAAARVVAGDEAGAREDLAQVERSAGPAALLVASFAAQTLEDGDLEDRLLASLGRVAPFLTYPFERRSFLAFDRDDPLTAAQVLAVALELDPASDLYWTNLGWARYLLGDLAGSEAASRRALELDASQFIARYNLGLVEVVTGRLEDALSTYAAALRLDPEVDDEAINDLVAAEERYPEALGVPFALATLLDQEGDRDGAAAAFERYAARAAAATGSADAGRADEARRRAEALRAPPAPIEVMGDVTLSLGARGAALEEVRPGDPLTVAFEVGTPGDALPRRFELEATLRASDAAAVLAEAGATVDVPTGAIGFVIDVLRLELPLDLPAGSYTIDVVARGDGLEAAATRSVAVAGAPDVFRRLVGRGLTPTALESGQALVAERDLSLGRAALLDRLLQELLVAAPSADDVLPPIEAGRFAGRGGGEAFLQSGPEDVRDFLEHLLASGARDASFAFVDAYAQWVVDGTPTAP